MERYCRFVALADNVNKATDVMVAADLGPSLPTNQSNDDLNGYTMGAKMHGSQQVVKDPKQSHYLSAIYP